MKKIFRNDAHLSTLLLHLVTDGKLRLDLSDEITQGTLVSHDGDVVHPRVRELLSDTED